MNDIAPQILARLAARSYQTTPELAAQIPVSRDVLVTQLADLRRRGIVDRRCRPDDRAWVWFVCELEYRSACDLEEVRELLRVNDGLTRDQGMALVRECSRMRNEVVSMRVEVELMKARVR